MKEEGEVGRKGRGEGGRENREGKKRGRGERRERGRGEKRGPTRSHCGLAHTLQNLYWHDLANFFSGVTLLVVTQSSNTEHHPCTERFRSARAFSWAWFSHQHLAQSSGTALFVVI